MEETLREKGEYEKWLLKKTQFGPEYPNLKIKCICFLSPDHEREQLNSRLKKRPALILGDGVTIVSLLGKAVVTDRSLHVIDRRHIYM